MDDFYDNKLIFLYSRVYALRQYDAGASLRTWFQRIQRLCNTKTRYLENRITKLRNYEITKLQNYIESSKVAANIGIYPVATWKKRGEAFTPFALHVRTIII